ncbi:Uncharacterised protein [uncultured archaeon]|nr:Uncharacterised protein [uncultured archaeon]
MASSIPALICDASALISITDSCFIHVLYMLKRGFSGAYVMPPCVYEECVVQPRRIMADARYALRVERAVSDEVLDVVPLADPGDAAQILQWANSIFTLEGRPLPILQRGEAECLALALETGVRDLLMDERTTRLLLEDPAQLTAHLQAEYGERLRVRQQPLDELMARCKTLRFYRSSEMLLLAYQMGFFDDYWNMKEEALEAALYRLKYSGCALSEDEIEQSMKLALRGKNAE